jgi:hypothetical protein
VEIWPDPKAAPGSSAIWWIDTAQPAQPAQQPAKTPDAAAPAAVQ